MIYVVGICPLINYPPCGQKPVLAFAWQCPLLKTLPICRRTNKFSQVFISFYFYLQMGVGVGTTPGVHSWKTWLHSKASAAGRQGGPTAFSSVQAVWTRSSCASSGAAWELLKKTRASFARTALHSSPLYWAQ